MTRRSRARRRRRFWRHVLFVELGGRDRTGVRWWHRPAPLMGWVVYQCMAHLTPRALAAMMVGLLPTVGLLSIGVDNPVSAFGFALLSLMVMDVAAGFVFRPRLHVACHLPPRAARGARVLLEYRVRNRGRWTARDLSVDTLRGYDSRSMRLRSALPPPLPPGAGDVVEGELRILKRGRYRLPPLRVDSSFPLGFWRWGQTDWETARMLNVYPAYVPLSRFELPLGARQRLDTSPARQLARSALEFHACREFRQGDSLRHVYPRSSARLGMPVVKEFLAEGEGRTAVVTDTWRRSLAARRGRRDDLVVEAALSLTAAVVEALSRTDRVLELLVAGPGVFRFESAGRRGFFTDVLDILAEVEPCNVDPLPSLAPVLESELRAIQSVCLLLGRWDVSRARWVAALQASQVGLKVVVVSQAARRPAGLPPEAGWVNAHRVLQGEVAVL